MTPAAFVPQALPVRADDGHASELLACIPEVPRASLLWLPALGVAARHYLPFAEALAARGVAVFVHEWRGHGSSSVRATRDCDWNYRTLLCTDLPAAEAAIATRVPGLARIVGGHSLGGQLACCRLALSPLTASHLWLVASGAPWWRAFPAPRRYVLPLVYRFLPWLAARRGALPGRTIGFGGNEARGLIADWARTGLSGRYAAAGLDIDLEARLREVDVDVTAVVMTEDWLGPESSLRFLLAKLASGHLAQVTTLDANALGTRADHFAWMRTPGAVADVLGASLEPRGD
ncbi:alpha/beta fold hydrolase [Luteimonas yindakuii]|uniref:Alpha/beta fold hydrolase n=1 Tax=Luteimonas yindakuii TaxID=2565782 RepID=A0A4Z1R4Z6_9GAMM|nr:alpha/beta fold hydrolase [Luteimonas yindakuii]QCO67390.1 alpha/beta fold hydrolase [Luteimonas yindakuii]TKS53615.1 alpha/beta fold hydrolase [Luteimonas yindakuii]